MKIIILISSIFYILGLKISSKIDLVKPSHPVQKVITHTIKAENSNKSIDYKQAEIETKEIEASDNTDDCDANR